MSLMQPGNETAPNSERAVYAASACERQQAWSILSVRTVKRAKARAPMLNYIALEFKL